MPLRDTIFKVHREICSLTWRLFLFSKGEFILLFKTHPLKKGLIFRKIVILTTIAFISNLAGRGVLIYYIQILFLLPIILGCMLTIYTYKDYKDELKYSSDCVLYGLAAITSAYLVTNTGNAEINFFENYMRDYKGFLATNFFAVSASIRFSISCADAWEMYISKYKK